MAKRFNTTGTCFPAEHYMVDISSRLSEIKKMVDCGYYFTINRARQYGKTTTLRELEKKLAHEYLVLSLSFEILDSSSYETIDSFCRDFLELMRLNAEPFLGNGIPAAFKDELNRTEYDLGKRINFLRISVLISELCKCADKPVVLIIDEVDKSCNNQVFVDFLSMLRSKYLERDRNSTFQSVILAGVYDVKNLKMKLREDREHRHNSPWNVAKDFQVDMSFSPQDIATMLAEYESDYQLDIDIKYFSERIYAYTSGYPFLVSYFCEVMDERLIESEGYRDKKSVWSEEGFQRAVKIITTEPCTLFDDMTKKLEDFPELDEMVKNILMHGMEYSYTPGNYDIQIGIALGFLKREDSRIVVANRIFEIFLYNLYLSREELSNPVYECGASDKMSFIKNGELDMDAVMKRFYQHFVELFQEEDAHFIEDQGRKIFLTFLKPVINGVGNYYVEARTRNRRRTDVIVDYRGKQYVIEMKIWHGQEYLNRGQEQLFQYLEDYHQQKGYLLSFNFNKNKETGVKEVAYRGKRILEVVV